MSTDLPEYWVSCTSPRWAYAQDQAVFEVRRAIANLVRSMESPAQEGFHDPKQSEVLAYVEAADRVSAITKVVLGEVVAEASALKVTQAAIAKRLGISSPALIKRYGKGLQITDERRDELAMEDVASRLVWVSTSTIELGDEELATDDKIASTASTPKTAKEKEAEAKFEQNSAKIVVESFQRIWRSVEQLQTKAEPALLAAIRLGDNDTNGEAAARALDTYSQIYDEINDSIKELMESRAIFHAHLEKSITFAPCNDYNPSLYTSYALFQAAIGGGHIGQSIEALQSSDAEGFLTARDAARERFGVMLNLLTRPECLLTHQTALNRITHTDQGDFE